MTIAPLCGIQITDYFLLNRRRVSIRAIYDPSPTGAYYYWHGVNPIAMVSMLAGFGIYIYLLNPVTYKSHWPYEVLTASLPTVVLAGAIYGLLTLVFTRRSGRSRTA